MLSFLKKHREDVDSRIERQVYHGKLQRPCVKQEVGCQIAAAKISSCFSGSRVVKECAHKLSLMKFIYILAFVTTSDIMQKGRMKMAHPGLFPGLIKTI